VTSITFPEKCCDAPSGWSASANPAQGAAGAKKKKRNLNRLR
jgi:hypothetical protein